MQKKKCWEAELTFLSNFLSLVSEKKETLKIKFTF